MAIISTICQNPPYLTSTTTIMDEEQAPATPQLKTNSTEITEKASPADSEESLVIDDPDYIAPGQQNFLLLDRDFESSSFED